MTKFVVLAVAAAVAFAPAAYAADAAAPKTEAECAKVKDMKWDATTKKCVKAEPKK